MRKKIAHHHWERKARQRTRLLLKSLWPLVTWVAGRRELQAAYRSGFFAGPLLVRSMPVDTGFGDALFVSADGCLRVDLDVIRERKATGDGFEIAGRCLTLFMSGGPNNTHRIERKLTWEEVAELQVAFRQFPLSFLASTEMPK